MLIMINRLYPSIVNSPLEGLGKIRTEGGDTSLILKQLFTSMLIEEELTQLNVFVPETL